MLVTAIANNTVRGGVQSSTRNTTCWTWPTTVLTWITSGRCIGMVVSSGSHPFRNLRNCLLVTWLILICLILKTTTNIHILSSIKSKKVFYFVFCNQNWKNKKCTKKFQNKNYYDKDNKSDTNYLGYCVCLCVYGNEMNVFCMGVCVG